MGVGGIELSGRQEAAIQHQLDEQRGQRGRFGAHEREVTQRRNAVDLDREARGISGTSPTPLHGCSHLNQMRRHVTIAMLVNHRQRASGSDPLRPERTADERGLRRRHHRRDTDDRRHRVAVGDAFREHGDVGDHAERQVDAAGVHAPPGGDLIENQYRADARRDLTNAFEKPGRRSAAAGRFHDDGGQLAAMRRRDRLELVDRVVVKGQHGAGEPARYARWFEAGKKVPVERMILCEVRGEIPVVPAVVPTEGHAVPAGGCARESNGDRHRLTAAPAVPDHFRPGMEVDQELPEFHFLRAIERAHRTRGDRANDRRVDIRIGKS